MAAMVKWCHLSPFGNVIIFPRNGFMAKWHHVPFPHVAFSQKKLLSFLSLSPNHFYLHLEAPTTSPSKGPTQPAALTLNPDFADPDPDLGLTSHFNEH